MKTHNVLSSLVISAMSVLVPAGGADASSEVVLHNFPANVFPYGQLLLEKSGTLYGTTMAGGVQNLGTVYEMKPTRNGWKEKEIYSFNGGDASYPSAGAINGTNSQTLYGVTTGGPNGEAGTVFSLVRDGRLGRKRLCTDSTAAAATVSSPKLRSCWIKRQPRYMAPPHRGATSVVERCSRSMARVLTASFSASIPTHRVACRRPNYRDGLRRTASSGPRRWEGMQTPVTFFYFLRNRGNGRRAFCTRSTEAMKGSIPST